MVFVKVHVERFTHYICYILLPGLLSHTAVLIEFQLRMVVMPDRGFNYSKIVEENKS